MLSEQLSGSILSCNIVTPIVRNEIAANRQKTGIAKLNSGTESVSNINSVSHKREFIARPSMQNFYKFIIFKNINI